MAAAFRDGGATAAPPAAGPSLGADRLTAFARSADSAGALTIFHDQNGNHLAWHLYAEVDSTHVYEYVIDATSGRVLFRANQVVYSSGEGDAWLYAPSPDLGPVNSLADGHTALVRNYPDGWSVNGTSGGISSTALAGNNAHVYSDIPDDNVANPGDEIPKSGTDVEGHPEYNYTATFDTNNPDNKGLFENCSTEFPCTWEAFPFTYTTNLRQNAAQVFWFVNNFHDHLEQPPIGFTEASGNFQVTTRSRRGRRLGPGRRPTTAPTPTATGGPDNNHINNANMAHPAGRRTAANADVPVRRRSMSATRRRQRRRRGRRSSTTSTRTVCRTG